MRHALTSHPLHMYSLVNGHPYNRWPYPSGFLPWILAADWLTRHIGHHFDGWVQLPQIFADAALAWFVQDFLRLRGCSERLRLTAAAVVAFGPSFFIVSGYHGQIDSLAILPAVAALYVWERSPPGVRRA